MTPPIAQIIVTQRETYQQSLASLRSLLDNTPTPRDIVIVDAGSPPRVRDALRSEAEREPGIQLLRVEQPLAPNQAKHLAMPHFRQQHLVFVENDVEFSPGWLQALRTCSDETNAAVVAPLYLERQGDDKTRLHMLGGQCRIVEGREGRQLVQTHELRQGRTPDRLSRHMTEHIEMHGFLLNRDWLRNTDLFDPEIPSMPENADFCLQISQAGGTMWIEPQARLTVVLPQSVADEDQIFFRQRWSDEWIRRGFSRFCSKWNLTGSQPALDSQLRWAHAHRLISYHDALYKRLGLEADSIVNRRLLAPFECWWRSR